MPDLEKGMHFEKFIPFTKMDEATRTVWGLVTSQALDKDGERCHYKSTKPLYQEWCVDTAEASHGKSIGDMWSMHTKRATGRFIKIVFDDVNEQIWMAGEVVDNNEWEKCQKGILRGFSHGGSYAKIWNENGDRWYTGRPREVSIVDKPNNPEATFKYVKMDGTCEMRKFSADGKTAVLAKSLWDVGELASILDSLGWMRDCLAMERDIEGDNSKVPATLATWIEEGTAILKQLVDEETSELTAGAAKVEKSHKEQSMTPEEKLKLEALEKENKDLKDAATLAKAAPAGFVSIGKTADGVEVFKKAEAAAAVEIVKENAEVTELKKQVGELVESNKLLNEGLQKLLATPETPKAAASANGGVIAKKEGDVADGKEVDLSKMSPQDQIKHIHGNSGRAETPRGPA